MKALAASITLSIAITVDLPEVKAASLIQKDLFFGRNISNGGQVSEEEFQTFVDNIITPRFPDGLTIFNTDGQFLNSTGNIIQEPSKVVTLFAEDNQITNTGTNEIVASYLKQFSQESVLQVTNKDDLKVGFGIGENLIDNNPIPDLIRTDLFFGRNIPGGGVVTEKQFQSFVDNFITPRFPAGLTIFDGLGQFRNSAGNIIAEPSKAVTLFIDDTVENELALDEVIRNYIQQFTQESVLLAVNEDVAVGFSAGENLIDNDPIPEFIQTDLFFGRNIPGGGVVTENQFQAFVDSIITPRFPAGLTIFDSLGQFKDSTGNIIEEQSKVVRLLLEDTTENEAAIDEIIRTYIQQFNQESVLLAVDEDIEVAFGPKSPTAIPEPSIILGLILSSATGILVRKKRHYM
jgi:transcription termination factor NusB